MGWNARNELTKKSRGSSSTKWILWGISIVGVCAVLSYVLFNNGRESVKPVGENKHGVIKEVVPEVREKTTAEEISADQKPIDPNARPTQAGQVLNGYILTGSGRMHKIRGAITNNIGLVKADYEIFDHYCENEIACLLSLKPGATIVGDPPYRGRLIADFIESLKDPIIVKDADSEHDKELKRAVIATKIDLKEAMDRGENIEQILLDARAECRRLAEYKRLLQDEVREKVKDGEMSPEDFKDYVDAANKMLEDKGIAPLRLSPIMKRKLMLDATEE